MLAHEARPLWQAGISRYLQLLAPEAHDEGQVSDLEEAQDMERRLLLHVSEPADEPTRRVWPSVHRDSEDIDLYGGSEPLLVSPNY